MSQQVLFTRPVSTILAATLLIAGAANAQQNHVELGFQQSGDLIRGADCADGEIYDDGTAENGYSGNPGLISNFQGTQQFTPMSYPGTYDTVCVSLTTIAAGGPTLDFEIQVHDDDGAGGIPGTLLGSVPVSVNDIPVFPDATFYEVDITSLNLNIPSGNVWIGVHWNPMDFPSRFVAADETPATPLHPGFLNFNNPDMWEATETVFPDYRAKMIRAVPGVVGADADLSTTKTATVNPDETVDFTITVTNNGPDDATNVVVTDPLPPCTTYISDDCGSMNVPPWTWNVGNLPAGNSGMCTLTVDASACQGQQTNTATATADQSDPNPGDESGTATFNLAGLFVAVPTLGWFGVLALIALLLGLATWRLRAS